jgi:hypothetical protein
MMTTGKESKPDQRATIERLLLDEQVLVHINPLTPGLVLPEHLRDSRTVTLRLSRFFKGELFTDEQKVSAELLFGSTYFTCVIPWAAIWGASSIREEEYLWPDAAPPEIVELAMAQQQRQALASTKTSSTSEGRATVDTGPAKRSAGHLRRVK